MDIKKFITLIAFIFLALFGLVNNENDIQYNKIATIKAPLTQENDIIRPRRVFSFTSCTYYKNTTCLKNHHNIFTFGTNGLLSTNKLCYYSTFKNFKKEFLNKKSLAQNQLLFEIQKTGPPFNISI